MTLPRRLLLSDEEIVLERGLHLFLLLPTIVSSLLILAGVGAGFFLWHGAPLWFGATIGFVFLLVVSNLAITAMRFRSTTLVLTTSRLIYRTGLLRHRTREAMLTSIVEIHVDQRLRDRLFGRGTLVVDVGAAGGTLTFRHLSRPREMLARLQELRDRPDLLKVSHIGETLSGQSARTSRAHLDQLHERGIITGDEHEHHARNLEIEETEGES